MLQAGRALPSAPAGRGCGHSQAQGGGFVPAGSFSNHPRGCSQPGAGILLQGQWMQCPCSLPTRILLRGHPPGTVRKGSAEKCLGWERAGEGRLCMGVEAILHSKLIWG